MKRRVSVAPANASNPSRHSIPPPKKKHLKKRINKMLSDVIIIILEMNIPWPAPIRHDKILVPGRSFIACIRRQHTLDTNTDAFDRLHGRPARRTKQVQTDNPVAVDVRVDGDRARGFGGCCGGQVDKLDFGGFFFYIPWVSPCLDISLF